MNKKRKDELLQKSTSYINYFHKVDLVGSAAQVAYFLLLSIFPLLIFVVTLIGYFPVNEAALAEFIETYTPKEITQFIQMNINQLIHVRNGGLLSLGLIGTLWSASNGINALTKALNRAHETEGRQSYIIARLFSLLFAIGVVGVIVIALLLPVFGKMIGSYLFSLIGMSEDFIKMWDLFRWIISSMVLFLALAIFYKIAPNRSLKFREVYLGAVVATLAWQTISFGFSYYVETIGDYSATYGSLGTVIMLLVWFYISSMVIIIGGVINGVRYQIKRAIH